MDVRDFMHNDVKVKVVDENELVVEGNVEKRDGGSVSKKNFRRSFIFPGLVKLEAVSSAMSSDGVLTINVPKKEEQQNITSKRLQFVTNENQKTSTSSQKFSSSESSHKNLLHSLKQESTKNVKCQESEMENRSLENDLKDFERENLLPISEMGHLFHEDFFANAHQDFENAVKKVLNQWEESASTTDDFNSYRSLREKDLRDENQAVSITEDHQAHKVS